MWRVFQSFSIKYTVALGAAQVTFEIVELPKNEKNCIFFSYSLCISEKNSTFAPQK